MGRSRYVITEPDSPHFLTFTVVEWLPVFTRPDAVRILLDSWLHQRTHESLQLYGYVVLENHLHFIAQTPRLDHCVSSFKSYTAARLLELLKVHRVERILERLRFAKKAHKKDRNDQFWQEGSHAELIVVNLSCVKSWIIFTINQLNVVMWIWQSIGVILVLEIIWGVMV